MRVTGIRTTAALVAVLGLGFAACGSDESSSSAETSEAVETPTIVVTTNILGDVVSEVVGDAAEVVTIMPVGADPHNFQASAQEVDTLMNADVLIVNGAGFEEGLHDVLENAEDDGIPTFEAIGAVDTIEFGPGGHDHADEEHADDGHADENHSDEEHADEDHADDDHADDDHADDDHADEDHADDEHDHDGVDPHFFTDPVRMAAAVEGIVEFLRDEIDVADPAALDATADAYIAELMALDVEVSESVVSIPDERRVLVTNHDVFGYFADRYGFEVVGAVIPGGGTADSASAGELAELAEVIEAEDVPAIFADTSSPDQLIQTLAEEVGDIAVVELYSESLGEPGSDGGTYLGMVRTNGQRISEALG